MKVFVTGSTGFVGSEVVRQLVAADHRVVALVRPGSEEKLVEAEQVELHHGDVTEAESLPAGMEGCDAVIHLVGIIREFPDRGITFEKLHVEATRNVLAAASEQGIKRYLHMSANGVGPDSDSGYEKSKWKAEELVRDCDLDWTIIRPSIIFGPKGEFLEMLGDLVRKLPIVPVVGDGEYRLQPVAVDQVAETFVKALEKSAAVGQEYHLGGAKSYTYDRILDLVGKALGKNQVRKVHQPVAMVKPMVELLESFEKFPLTSDQLTMMLNGNECDPMPWATAFDITPIDFAEGVMDCFEKES